MNTSNIRSVAGKISVILAGVSLWLIAAALLLIDIPHAIKDGIIHGVALDIFFIVLGILTGTYCFLLVLRKSKKQKETKIYTDEA